ncbi:unnamed protein product [Lampetra planeri]
MDTASASTMASPEGPQGKMINDPIHGLIELKKPLLLIVDTPEFQRLRFIKQLGLCHKVYPSAVHTRFEHSIGTAHLAGQLVRHLKEYSKERNITDMDVLCMEIAGLCHDLGHGPFSHAFEAVMKKKGIEWKHELKSVEMLCHLIEKNNLQKDLENCGLQFPKHLILIASLIVGKFREDLTEIIEKKYEDAKESSMEIEKEYKCKMFLFEIVANDLNGIDVDKFDYFARDAYYLGFNTGFDHQRYIQNARVCEFHGDFHICQPKKQWSNLLELFHVRERLHRNAYQHRVTKLIEHKVAEAIKEGYSKLIGDKVNSMESYSTLTDSIYETILHSDDEELYKAKDIMMDIERRNLPKFVGEIPISQGIKYFFPSLYMYPMYVFVSTVILSVELTFIQQYTHTVISSKLETMALKGTIMSSPPPQEASWNYGKKDKNPLDSFGFYTKHATNVAEKFIKMNSTSLPQTFEEHVVYIYSTGDMEEAKRIFDAVAQEVRSCNVLLFFDI